MTNRTADVNAWRQEGLFPAENVRVRCDIHVEEAGNRNDFSVDVIDLQSGEVIAIWCLPLRDHDSLADDLDRVLAQVRELVRHHALPFA